MSWHETEDNSGQYELNNIWSVGKNSACIQMAVQCIDKRFCPGLFADTDPEQGAEVLHWFCGSDACSRLSGLLDCLGTLLRAASLGWDLGLEPCPIKSVLFAVCLQKSPCQFHYGRPFHGLTSAAGGDSWEAEACCNYNFIPKPQTSSWEAKWAQTWAGSQWVFLLFKAIFNKKSWERARVTSMPFQWSLIPPW